MATTYSITINIDPTTLSEIATGYSLYGFKAVQGPPGGAPVVWFSTNRFSESTVITWQEQYYAYTSDTVDLSQNVVVSASATSPIELGQLATVGAGGMLTASEGQDPLAVSIFNPTLENYSCGLSQLANAVGAAATYNPMCAFPLLASMQDEIVPIEQVFLMFASQEVNTGTVLEESYSYGALVDLTANNNMVLTYNLVSVPGGWVTEPGVTVQPPNTQLVPLLISPVTSSAASASQAQLPAR
jgi:hypothetical protein